MSIKEEQEERREKRGEITAQKLGATRAIKIPEKNENPLEKNNNNNKKKKKDKKKPPSFASYF